jgi:hypothetical protein
MGTWSLAGVKRPRRGVNHPPPSSAKVKESVELYLYFPSGPSWPFLGWTLPYTFLSLDRWQKGWHGQRKQDKWGTRNAQYFESLDVDGMLNTISDKKGVPMWTGFIWWWRQLVQKVRKCGFMKGTNFTSGVPSGVEKAPAGPTQTYRILRPVVGSVCSDRRQYSGPVIRTGK